MASAITAEQALACSHCGEARPLTAFHRAPTKRGYDPRCKPCRAAYARERYHANLDEARVMNRAAQRKFRFATKYGISIEKWQEMANEQAGACAICGITPSDVRDLCVDHCHVTGAVRGLLCHSCNNGLGRFKDDADRLLAATAYLLSRKA